VAVCGGGDAGLIEAGYLARHAAKVHVIEAGPALSAAASLQEQVCANAKIDIRCETRPVRIAGKEGVTGLEIMNDHGRHELLAVHGVLARVGFDPATRCLGDVPLDAGGYVEVDDHMASALAGIFAAGDIRRESPRGVASAVSDGTIAARSAMRLLAG
jgi:thioredoxin reductase (NADPH)